MNLHSLRIFHAIASEGSFTRAAKLLVISQPAVSQQLQQLESQFEMKLLDRLPRGVKLTREGEVLYSYSSRIFAIENECEATMSAMSENSYGRLAIGASTTIFDYLLPTMVSIYLKEFPNIELQLEVGNTEEICNMIADGVVEFGLLEGTNITNGVEINSFGTDEMVVVANPNCELANLPLPIKLEDLTNYPFISREKGSGSQAVIESAIAEVGLLLNPIVRLGSTAAILRSVEAELGFGIVSSIAAKTALENEKIKKIPVEGLKIARKLLMGFLPDRQLSIAAKSFVLLLEDPKNIFS
ncbi:MAG: hypothetical protein CL934_08375 [Deltaproteobacteria bacterium]|nr:hypothetical protein [Deltaproteobacteria bacterium]